MAQPARVEHIEGAKLVIKETIRAVASLILNDKVFIAQREGRVGVSLLPASEYVSSLKLTVNCREVFARDHRREIGSA